MNMGASRGGRESEKKNSRALDPAYARSQGAGLRTRGGKRQLNKKKGNQTRIEESNIGRHVVTSARKWNHRRGTISSQV